MVAYVTFFNELSEERKREHFQGEILIKKKLFETSFHEPVQNDSFLHSLSLVSPQVMFRLALLFVLGFAFVSSKSNKNWDNFKRVPKYTIFSRGALILSRIDNSLRTAQVNVSKDCEGNLFKLVNDFTLNQRRAIECEYYTSFYQNVS